MIKVVFAGETNVGKTSIVEKSLFNKFGPNAPTMGVSFVSKTLSYSEKSITVGLWDTAGQERFQSMSSIYFRNAMICILVFDLTNKRSFEKIPMWKNFANDATFELKDYNLPIFILVGNKNDMTPKIDKSIIDDFCKNCNIHHYIETSALTNYGIDELYETIARESIKLHLPIEQKIDISSPLPSETYQCPCL